MTNVNSADLFKPKQPNSMDTKSVNDTEYTLETVPNK